MFSVFALYKNFTLLACLCGRGIGYALAHRSPLLLPITLPLLALTIFLLISLRYASLGDIFFFVPVKEETSVFDLHNMLPEWASAALNIPAYLLLIVTFIPNVIIMVPVAQFCGHANTLAGCIGILTMRSWEPAGGKSRIPLAHGLLGAAAGDDCCWLCGRRRWRRGAADFSAKLTLVALLTGPLLFSGILFSTLLKSVNDLPSALAYNLLGPCWGDCWNTIPWSLVLLSCTCSPSRCMGWRSPPHGCGRPARDDSVGCSRRTSASLRAVVPFKRHRSADADGQSGTPTSGGASHPMNRLFPIPAHP
jgi:hypothetical protein